MPIKVKRTMQNPLRNAKRNYAQYREAGIALPEAMISLVIIAIVLVANALALLSAYSAFGSADNNNKAYQLINQQFAVFKQAPWAKLGTVVQTGATAGCDTYASPFNNESVAAIPATGAYGYTSADSSSPLQYCQGYQYPARGAKPVMRYTVTGGDLQQPDNAQAGLGITYYVTTVITNVSTSTFDNSTVSVQHDATTHYNAKRITVTVKWTENDSSGNSKQQQLRMSTVRTPGLNECVPTGVKDSSNNAVIATGC
jgi:Tfp pilus assembly protein PilV